MAKSRKQIKRQAKAAAAAGNLTNRQVRQLQKAGVKSSAVNRIKTSNAQGYAANRAQTVYNNTPAQSGPAGGGGGAPARTTPEIKGVKQGLRIAGAGGISGSDLKTIRKATDKSNEQLISKLDKINKNLRSKDKTGISLNAGALNKIIKKGVKQRAKDPFGIVDFGTGKIGQDIMSRMGIAGSKGTYIKGELVGARDAVEPRFLEGGMQITPGGRERVRGFGKQYELPERFKPPGEEPPPPPPPPPPGPTVEGGDGGDVLPVTPPPEEPVDTSQITEASPFDLASWASGFKRARSSRQRAGRRAQGLASQKKSPFKSWNQ